MKLQTHYTGILIKMHISRVHTVSKNSEFSYFFCVDNLFKGQWHRNKTTMQYLESCPFFDKKDGMKYHGDPKCYLHSLGINIEDFDHTNTMETEKKPNTIEKIVKLY